MALQTFTAGQVLTAAQVTALQTNGFNQTVSTKTADHTLVAADKGTRVEMNSASATTITVDTDLFNAGDTLFIQNIGAGVCTITAGTATVSTSGDLALVENAGGTLFFVSAGVAIFYATGVTAVAAPSGLTLISTTTVSVAAASISVNDCFSATFNNYFAVFELTPVASGTLNVRLRNSGSDRTDNAYAFISQAHNSAGTSVGNFGSGTSGATQQSFAAFANHGTFQIQNPFVAAKTSEFQTHYGGVSSAGSNIGGVSSIRYSTANSNDGLTLFSSAGNITGTISIYGYQN